MAWPDLTWQKQASLSQKQEVETVGVGWFFLHVLLLGDMCEDI